LKWFRSNIEHGSRLALFALVVQFALSFGHFHNVIQAASAIRIGLTQANPNIETDAAPDKATESTQQSQPANHNSDRQPADACAICAAITLANNVLFAAPPVLLLPQVIELLYLTTDAEFVHLNSVRPAFQSRAPPLS
jgi:Protein of unknown function (DUF2946)